MPQFLHCERCQQAIWGHTVEKIRGTEAIWRGGILPALYPFLKIFPWKTYPRFSRFISGFLWQICNNWVSSVFSRFWYFLTLSIFFFQFLNFHLFSAFLRSCFFFLQVFCNFHVFFDVLRLTQFFQTYSNQHIWNNCNNQINK